SWVVGGALLLASLLAARELGVHWIGALFHGALVQPATGAAAAYVSWRDARAESERRASVQAAKSMARKERRPRAPDAAQAELDLDAEPANGLAPAPRISGRAAEANGKRPASPDAKAIAVPVIK